MTSAEDESRYGRMSLLVLNIAPIVLRQVIDHQCTVATYHDFEDALNLQIHNLFHLLFRNCCCGNVNNRTILTKPQWDLLYIRVPAPLPHRPRGECPCSYQAISGVTSGGLDLTLCCVILRNLFPSMSLTDVDTIRTVRNDLIHANNACLDSSTFQTVWSAVSQALSSLSLSVSPTCHNDTTEALKRLEDRVIDHTELQVLADIMKDNRQYEDLRDNINRLQTVQLCSEAERETNARRIQELASKLQQAETRQRSHEDMILKITEKEKRLQSQFLRMVTGQRSLKIRFQEKKSQTHKRKSFTLYQRDQKVRKRKESKESKEKLRQYLVKNYQKILECISFTPLNDQNLTLEQIYTPVIVEEDPTKEGTKPIKSGNRRILEPKDIFYSSDKVVERVFMKGEAGKGKTVFGLKLLHDWCRLQEALGDCKLQEYLSSFELTFFISCRHTKQGITHIVDMVCDTLPSKYSEVIRHVLSDENTQCLVILDGLDEWSCPSDYDDFPDSRDLDNCVLFTTTRPWKLEKLRLKYSSCDKVIEIQGINPKSFKEMIKRVVAYLYENDESDDDIEDDDICLDDHDNMHETENDDSELNIETECEDDSTISSDFGHDDDSSISSDLGTSDDSEISSYSERDEYIFPEDFGRRLNIFIKKVEDPSIKSLMSIPMMLTASCHVWYENNKKKQGTKNDVMTSMTYFSLAIIDILIKRSKSKEDIKHYLQHRIGGSISTSTIVPTLLSRFFPNIMDFMEIIMPFCELAYKDLLANETRLVFEKDHLEREMGKTAVDLALKVGFVNQCKAPGSFNIQNVSVSFYHKLIQEIMAAIYIVCTPDLLQTFCDQCHSLDKILDLFNCVMFISGLDSSVGQYQLSQHIGRMVETDKELSRYRQKMDYELRKVHALYDVGLKCYREMIHLTGMMGIARPPPDIISDVYIDKYDRDVMRVTEAIVSDIRHTVMSVHTENVPHISSILSYLPKHSASLTALSISDCDEQSCNLLVTVLPKLTQLQCFRFDGDYRDVDALVVEALTGLTRLKHVCLYGFWMNDNTLDKTTLRHFTKLETLDLWSVYKDGRWGDFLSILPHKVKVTLAWTDIDVDSIEMIHSSPKFTLIKHETDHVLGLILEFYTET